MNAKDLFNQIQAEEEIKTSTPQCLGPGGK